MRVYTKTTQTYIETLLYQADVPACRYFVHVDAVHVYPSSFPPHCFAI